MGNELPSCFASKEVAARKAHLCCECGKRIERGSKYVTVTGIWLGKPERFKQCRYCASLSQFASAFWQSTGGMKDEGPPLGDLWGWLSEFDNQDGSNDVIKAFEENGGNKPSAYEEG